MRAWPVGTASITGACCKVEVANSGRRCSSHSRKHDTHTHTLNKDAQIGHGNANKRGTLNVKAVLAQRLGLA